MPTYTPEYDIPLPNVNSPDDEDLWGDELNTGLSIIDTQLKANADQAAKATPATSTKTANYTILVADVNRMVLMDATAGALVATLPDPALAGNGFRVGVKKIDASVNAVTVDGITTDGSATDKTLTERGDSLIFITDGTGWYIEAEYNVAAPLKYGVYLTQTAATSVPNATWTDISWDTEAFDDYGWHTSGADVTVDFTGFVFVVLNGANDTSDNGSPGLQILKNGAVVMQKFMSVTSAAAIGQPGSTVMGVPDLVGLIPVVPGDVLKARIFRDGAGTTNTATQFTKWLVAKYR